jgi:hypothetical protein
MQEEQHERSSGMKEVTGQEEKCEQSGNMKGMVLENYFECYSIYFGADGRPA